MATKTQVLPDVVLEFADDDNIATIIHRLAASLGWPSLDELRKCRLEGFDDQPFVRVLQGGRLLYDDAQTSPPLGMNDCLTNGQPLVVVQQRLVAEGWRVRVPEWSDLWSDSEEEEGGWDALPGETQATNN